MKRILTIIVSLTSLNLFSQSGCTDTLANNYSQTAIVNDGSCTYNPSRDTAKAIGSLMPLVSESSGVIFTDGFIWTHNDSGNPNEIYKVDTSTARVVQTLVINNYSNVDWEDISADSNYIYIGDFGNNHGNRTDLKILKINKSQFIGDTSSSVSVSAEAINFSYSDQTSFVSNSNSNYDCESLLTMNDSLYLFTKDKGDFRTRIYKLPKIPGTYTISPYTTYNVNGLITGADYNPRTKEVVLIGYMTSQHSSFMYFLYDFNSDDFFSGNKRRIEIGNPYIDWQTEGVSYCNNDKIFLSCETSYVYATLYKIWKSDIKITGIENYTNKNLAGKLYPNPVQDKLFLDVAVNQISELIIWDLSGRKVSDVFNHDATEPINVGKLDKGVYFISLNYAGSCSVLKFVKN